MSYSAYAKKHKIKLSLSPFIRNGKWHSWRGYVSGHPRKYFIQPDTKEGYEAALLEFFIWKQSLTDARPNVAELKHHQKLLQNVHDWYSINGAPTDELETHHEVNECLTWIANQISSDHPAPVTDFLTKNQLRSLRWNPVDLHNVMPTKKYVSRHFGSIGYDLPAIWQERFRSQPVEEGKTSQTFEYWYKQYEEFKKLQVDVGSRSFFTMRDAITKVGFFVERVSNIHVKKFTDAIWVGYFKHLAATLKKGGTRDSYRKAAVTFFKWCKKQPACEIVIPATVFDDDYTFRDVVDEKPIGARLEELWTPEEIQAVIKSKEKFWKAFILLDLNCATLEQDLHDMKHENYKDGRLTYKRRKTKKQKLVPVVNYKLWNETIKAIDAIKTKDKEFLLQTARGNRIKSANNNNLSRNWAKVRVRLGLRPTLTLRKLRNTATTIIKDSDNYRDLEQLYLGHARTVASRHYHHVDGQEYKPLDDALVYLGKKLGIK